MLSRQDQPRRRRVDTDSEQLTRLLELLGQYLNAHRAGMHSKDQDQLVDLDDFFLRGAVRRH